MATKQADLSVITKSKDLCSYIMTITQKSPKQFRFTLVSRLQNYSFDIIESLYKANDTFVKPGDIKLLQIRRDHQGDAMTRCRLLTYMAHLCIRAKEFCSFLLEDTDTCGLYASDQGKVAYQVLYPVYGRSDPRTRG